MAAMTTPPVPSGNLPLSALPPASGRAGLAAALRSEWTKIRSVRSTYWTLIALLVVSIGLGVAISAGAACELKTHPFPKAGVHPPQGSAFGLFPLGQPGLAGLAAM